MSTPSIQTLITQAQQVLNLKSTNEIRATLAAVLANANVGTPLNPNLTTQQLWDEFYEIVRQPSDDIMSIVVDQMMRMVFSPPAPGGAGADKQVIFNDGGVLAGDAGLTYNKATDALTITGDLTVDTSTLKVDSTNDQVGIGTATPLYKLHAVVTSGAVAKFGASTAAIARLLVGNTVGDLEVKINANADGQITSDAGKYLGLGSNSSNDRVVLTTTGNLSITNGNVVMATSGKGIDFSAVTGGTGTATGNVLNDYEEGTFTPTISSGATAVTYSVQSGRYTKVGRIVEIHIQLTTTAATRDANQFIVGGLPFSSANFGSGVIGYSNSGFVSTAGGNKPNLYVSLTGVEFYNSAGGSFAGTTIANDAFDLRFSATYFV